jgi:hypothetical protein
MPNIVDCRRLSNSSSGSSAEVEEFGYASISTGYVDPKSLASGQITGFLETPELDDKEFPSLQPGISPPDSKSCQNYHAQAPGQDWIAEDQYSLSRSAVSFALWERMSNSYQKKARNRKDHPPSWDNGVMKRVPHVEVERKYRVALNDGFENLRNSIPHIAHLQRRVGCKGSKTSKAAVLSTAVSYIKRLEANVEKLKDEQSVLQTGDRPPKKKGGARRRR